jgi:hypothetical protein
MNQALADGARRDGVSFELHYPPHHQRRVNDAVEHYLMECVEMPYVTGAELVARASTGEELLALIRAEEDRIIQTYGPPYDDWGVTQVDENENEILTEEEGR